MDRVKALLKAYWEAANERGPHLEEFVRAAVAGAHGPVDADTIRQFLQAVEENLISNIENKALAGGPWALMKDQVIADTRAEIAELIARYAS